MSTSTSVRSSSNRSNSPNSFGKLMVVSVLEIANPYLGKVVGVYSDWTPLAGRNHPFPEDLDTADPWQFKNFRVS